MDPTAGRSVAQGLVLWLPVAAWAAIIFALSSESRPPDPAGLSGRPGWSLLAHFALYLVLGALLYRAFEGSGNWRRDAGTKPGGGMPGAGGERPSWANPCLFAFAAGALYAASDELHQYFVPMRQADAVDWLADLAGVLAGALAVLALGRRRGKF